MEDTPKDILEEEAFTDYWYLQKKHTKMPTYANAIMWAEQRQHKRDIEKANKWLKTYMQSGKDNIAKAMNYGFLADFVKAMEK